MARIDIGQGPGISRAPHLIEYTAVAAFVTVVALAGFFVVDACAAGRRDLAFVQVPVESRRGAGGASLGPGVLSGLLLGGMG